MKDVVYKIIVTDEDDYSHLVVATRHYDEALTALNIAVEASSVPSIVIQCPKYKSIRIEKSSVLKRVELGNQE